MKSIQDLEIKIKQNTEALDKIYSLGDQKYGEVSGMRVLQEGRK